MIENPILIAKKICKHYGDQKIIDNLSFAIAPGEIVGLLGHNGAGKTTLFHLTIGLIKANEGEIYFQNEKITSLPIHKRAKMGMGYLAQEPSIFRSLTVEENILAILETLPINKAERKRRLEAHLVEMNLTHLAKRRAYLLSGGEKRRVEISRALVTCPTLLLLDEPFANIDPLTIEDVKKMILLLKAKGISVFITDHNAREIFSLVDRSYLIQGGQMIASGTPSELVANEEARLTYLGHNFKL